MMERYRLEKKFVAGARLQAIHGLQVDGTDTESGYARFGNQSLSPMITG